MKVTLKEYQQAVETIRQWNSQIDEEIRLYKNAVGPTIDNLINSDDTVSVRLRNCLRSYTQCHPEHKFLGQVDEIEFLRTRLAGSLTLSELKATKYRHCHPPINGDY